MNVNVAEVNDKIEAFIIEMGLPFEQVQEGLWLIHDEADYIDNIVVFHHSPVLTFRVKLIDTPDEKIQPKLYKRLLELNATSMVAGAFALEDESVVIVNSVQSENLDENEFQAAIDSMSLAIREHYQELSAIIVDEDDDENQPVEAADQA